MAKKPSSGHQWPEALPSPPLAWTSIGGLFANPNPDLKPEEVWSGQAGIETGIFRYFWLKTVFFYHEIDKNLELLTFGAGPPTFNDIIINAGKVKRQGLEIEAETIPVYNTSLMTGFSYVDLNPQSDSGSNYIYSCDIGVRYDDSRSFKAELFGNYVWWNLDSQFMAEYGDFIWDFNTSKKIPVSDKIDATIFLSVHNIFNGNQYTFVDSKNPRRWAEAGVRFSF